MAEFIEAEGLIHLINKVSGGEFTLCGDAFDAGSERPGYEWHSTLRRTITCPYCAEIIVDCRGVRVNLQKEADA